MTIAEILALLNTFLPLLINTAETVFAKPGLGAAKKAAVATMATQVLAANGATPTDVPEEPIAGVIDETVAKMKNVGLLGVLTAPQVPPAVKAAAAVAPLHTGVTFEGGGSTPR